MVENQWRGVDVGDLVASQLAHFEDLIGKRVTLQGPKALLCRVAGAGHGVARTGDQRWKTARRCALGSGGRRRGPRFQLEWKEETSAPPERPKGFGHKVLSDMVRHCWTLA